LTKRAATIFEIIQAESVGEKIRDHKENLNSAFITSYERDIETDLDFAQARMYANKLGRFTTIDPILIKKNRMIDPQQLNLYIYVRDNPYKFIDESGEDLILANKNARQTFKEVTLRGLTIHERKNVKVLPNGKVVLNVPNAKLTTSTKNYKDLVNLINDKNLTIKVYTLDKGDSVTVGGLNVSYQDAYNRNGLITGAPNDTVREAIIPKGGGIPSEVTSNGNIVKQSAPEDAIFWHEVMGHGSGADNEATISIENLYRQSRSPILPDRTGTDHTDGVLEMCVTCDGEVIDTTTLKSTIQTHIEPQPLPTPPIKP